MEMGRGNYRLANWLEHSLATNQGNVMSKSAVVNKVLKARVKEINKEKTSKEQERQAVLKDVETLITRAEILSDEVEDLRKEELIITKEVNK